MPQDFTNTPSFVNLATRALPRPSATKMLPCGVPGDIGRTVEDILRLLPRRQRGRRRRRRLHRRPGRAGTRRIVTASALRPSSRRDAALRIELHDHVGHLVDDPDVVLRIDADLRGEQEAVEALADLARELAVAIELEQPRSAMRERARRGHRDRRMAGARVDEDVAARIRRHAADFAEIDVVGQRQRVRRRIEVESRRGTLGGSTRRQDAAPASEHANRGVIGFMRCSFIDVAALLARRRWRLQDVLLHAPRFDFAQDDLVRIAAVHHVDDLEARRHLARLAELAEHRAIQLRLVDLAGDVPRPRRVAVRIRIGEEDVLVRPRRDAQRPADAEIGDLADRLQIVVEHLIAVVGAIGHPHVAAPSTCSPCGRLNSPSALPAFSLPACATKRPFLSYFTTRLLQ